MNEIDKKKRRANWPGIEASLRACSEVYVSPKYKSAMKKYYIEGIEPEWWKGGPGLILRLICDPGATQEKWECWKEEDNPGKGTWRRFMNIQCETNIYMGGNSPFGGREEEIYDYFFSDLFKPYKRQLTEEDIYEYAQGALRPFVKTIGGISLATHSQVCREVDRLVQGVKAQSPASYRFEKEMNTGREIYELVFCPIAWAYQHPDKFDQKLKVPIRTLYKFLTNPKVSPLLRDTFDDIVEKNLESYAEQTGAGGLVSACFQYRSKAQLQAVLPLLSPHTRYPYNADTPEDRVVGLPRPTEEKRNRTSYRAISYLWKSGFIADRVSVVDDRTLFVQFRAPLGWHCLEYSLHALRQDVTSLEARITSAKPLPKDDGKRKQYARCVFVVEPLLGQSSVGASMIKGGVEFVQVTKGSDRILDKYLKRNCTLEEVLPELLVSEYSVIQEKGTSGHH